MGAFDTYRIVSDISMTEKIKQTKKYCNFNPGNKEANDQSFYDG